MAAPDDSFAEQIATLHTTAVDIGAPRLKRIVSAFETGEVLRSDASAHDRPHAAQPANDAKPAPDFFIPHNPNVQKGVVS